MIGRRPLLLNPGPVTLSERVRQALSGPDLCHREAEFADLQEEIRERLLRVYGLAPDEWTAVLLTGSGTAAVEAMIRSLVPRGGRLLVVENGVYGERMREIGRAAGLRVSRMVQEWGAPVEPDRLAGHLETESGPAHVAVVHHETTTGRLNDLEALAAVCRDHGSTLLVDGVSSFGAEPIEFEKWGIAACAAAANKCLHGVPGAAFVVLRRKVLPESSEPPGSLYLDLGSYARAQDRRDTPFTPAVHTFVALAEALRELEEEGGWRARRERYRALQEIVEEGLGRLGIRPLLPRAASSCVLRSYQLPEDLTYELLHDGLKDRGFVIYAGQGGLARRIFRISTMGDLSAADLRRFVAATEEVLRECR